MSADASKPRMSVTGSPEDYKPTYGDPKCYTELANAVEASDAATVAPGGVQAPPKVGAVGGDKYPGRALPSASAVETAKPREAGFAKKQADKQLQEQRQDLK